MPHKKASGTNDPEIAKKMKEGKLKQIGSQEGSNKYGKFKVKVYEKK
jgi:hypothetical protein